MRYQGLFTANCCRETVLQQPGLLEKMGRLMEQAARAGVLATDEWQIPDWCGAHVKLSAGEFTVTGAALLERKEPGVPYATFNVESLAEAIAWTKCFLQVIGEGECEIRPLGKASAIGAVPC